MAEVWTPYRRSTPECAYDEPKKENPGSGRPEGAAAGEESGAGGEEGGGGRHPSCQALGRERSTDGRILFCGTAWVRATRCTHAISKGKAVHEDTHQGLHGSR